MLQTEPESLKNKIDVFGIERCSKLKNNLRLQREQAQEMTVIWQNGMTLHNIGHLTSQSNHIKDVKKYLEDVKHKLKVTQ
ncbi:hypothetical protein JVT61DRAFT_15640 [Boletus reticuloceps]|uniref:Uncharacterized protein n=1 Tax=Boletus reticuloceps TaxID=495285 RepID=A0A8I2YC63_9AGAM|nr:hypothetical protein JVT61DRAFT_15640 [Boletus reticuloceps]